MGIQERKEREKRARQEAILKAAQKIFLTKGLDQATIDDVAEKAELSKGTIYLYFKSKEELYISVFLKGLDVLMGQFHAMRIQLPSARADELIQEVKEIYYRFFKEYPEYFYINSLLYHGRIKDKINPYIWAMTHQKTKKCLMVFAILFKKGLRMGFFVMLIPGKRQTVFGGRLQA